jgi:hypothetical protein
MNFSFRQFALAAALILGAIGVLPADEGMWVFDNLPLKQLKATYGFEPTPEWIAQLRGSAVRFNNGGSGSFVSADGLVMTNHHVGADTLQKLSTKEKDFYKVGFLAKSRAEELKAPDLELNVLIDIKDVTAEVMAAIKPGASDAEANTAKQAKMSELEKTASSANGLRNDVVTLYQGGRYALYTYKKYTDVRLVFAPEFDIAFFGGDPDNFEYPRYCLDVCFFRVYENDKPASPKHFLKWNTAGTKEGDLTFVAGHPGRTSRLFTVDHLKYLRDTSLPYLLDFLKDRESFLLAYAKTGPEAARQSKEDLFGYQNSLKARMGGYNGLKTDAFMARKQKEEAAFRAAVSADARMKEAYGDAWDKISDAQKAAAKILASYNFVERGLGLESGLFNMARTLVRHATETRKPNGDRLREFRESALESLKLDLFSDAPIYPEYEVAKLTHALEYWQKKAGDDDASLKIALSGKSPAERAKELVAGTKLKDVAARKAFAEMTPEQIAQSSDTMIKLAVALDETARALRTQRENQVEAAETANYGRIAKAIFEQRGDSVYPDATFTLRLAYGTVKGYTEPDGRRIPPYTTMGGTFAHEQANDAKEPYAIPKTWHDAKISGKLKLQTPYNFISTADIIGGNSGSPVVDRDNKVVGLIFDGNIHSLILDYGYDDTLARAVSVDSRAIIEALRSIYNAGFLADELTSAK